MTHNLQGQAFQKLYDGQTKFSTDKNEMRKLRPADFVRGDVVLIEVTVGRYWDVTANGRVLNWNSNRAYFGLSSVTLLVQASDDGEADDAPIAQGSAAITNYM